MNVSYGAQPIIKNLELSVGSGEIVALFGPSGGGKSTILKAVAGLLTSVSGRIVISGKTIMDAEVCVSAENRKVGLIFQDYALFPHLTVAQNIAFGLDSLSKAQTKQKVASLLELIKMSEYAQRFPHELSGGQQQRIAIVRALACEPELLLFDEAFSNIDPQFRFELIAEIRALLKQQNIAALFVTHNQDEAFAFCDKIAILNQGQVEQLDDAERLFNYPNTPFVAEFLGQGIWLACEVVSPTELLSELGSITYAGENQLSAKVGESVQVYIRPHQLTLTRSTSSCFMVTKERFCGENYESQIQCLGQTLTVKTPHSFLNQTVNVKVNAAVCSVFPQH